MKFVVDTSKPVNSIGELQERITKLRDTIEGAPLGSEDFKKLTAQLQQASSEMKVLEKNMEGLEPQQKAEAFLKMGEGIAGGFAVAQGALGLMGVESENLEKIQVKVQSAISIAMGIRMMSEAALMMATAKRVAAEKLAIVQSKVGVVVTKAQAVATGVAATAQGVFTGAIKLTTVGLKALKLAIIATGIGALVVALIAIGKAVYEWATATDVQVNKQKKLNQEIVKSNEEFKKNRSLQQDLAAASTEAERELAKLTHKLREQEQGLDDNSAALDKNSDQLGRLGDFSKESQQIIKNNSSILEENSKAIKRNINALDDRIAKVKEQIKTEQEDEQKKEQRRSRSSSRREKRKADEKAQREDIRKMKEELLLLEEQDATAREILKNKQAQDNELRDANQIRNEELRLQTIEQINKKYEQIEKNRLKRIQDETDAKAEEDRKAEEDKEKQHQETLTNLKETALKEYDNSLKSERQRELDDLQAHYDEILSAESLTAEERQKIHASLRQKQQEINEEHDAIEKQAAMDALNRDLDIMSNVLQAFGDNLDARQTELENQRNRELSVENLTNEEKDKINKRFDAKLKKQNKRAKNIAASQAIIQTFQGANSAFSALAPIPFVGPVLGGIAAGAAIASGLANVRKIYSQDVGDGGGGGAGSVSTAGGASTPEATRPATTGAFTLTGGTPQQEPVKAFVVTDEVTDSQAQLENIRQQSTI